MTGVEFSANENGYSCRLAEKHKFVSKTFSDDIEKETINIVKESGYEKEIGIEDLSVIFDYSDYDNYRIALISDSEVKKNTSDKAWLFRSTKGHTGFFLIYEIDSKRLIYLAEMVLNDDYCFAIDSFRYMDVLEIKLQTN